MRSLPRGSCQESVAWVSSRDPGWGVCSETTGIKDWGTLPHWSRLQKSYVSVQRVLLDGTSKWTLGDRWWLLDGIYGLNGSIIAKGTSFLGEITRGDLNGYSAIQQEIVLVWETINTRTFWWWGSIATTCPKMVQGKHKQTTMIMSVCVCVCVCVCACAFTETELINMVNDDFKQLWNLDEGGKGRSLHCLFQLLGVWKNFKIKSGRVTPSHVRRKDTVSSGWLWYVSG
jgi:hypothetical protein